MKDITNVIKYPSLSEKAVSLIDSQNKLVFIVDNNATKQDVKEALKKLFNVTVDKVNIIHDRRNKKKAIVKLNKKHNAEDIATELGIL